MTNGLPLDGSHLDIITLVEADHRAAEALMAEIESSEPGDRRDLFAQLVPFLVAHEMAEEQVVYPAVHTVTDAEDAMIERRLAEERYAKRLLRALEQPDPSSGAFASLFAELHQAVRAHAETEEAEVLPLVAELEQALDRPGMGSRYMAAKRRAPQRPHSGPPGAPRRTRSPGRSRGRSTASGTLSSRAPEASLRT